MNVRRRLHATLKVVSGPAGRVAGVLGGEPQPARRELGHHVLGGWHSGSGCLVGQFQRVAVERRVRGHPAQPHRLGVAVGERPARERTGPQRAGQLISPEALVTGGTRYELRLRQCPFREVAETHRAVVCQLHLGLMQGALEQMRAPLTAGRLQPFAEPSLCIATLEPSRSPGQPRPAN